MGSLNVHNYYLYKNSSCTCATLALFQGSPWSLGLRLCEHTPHSPVPAPASGVRQWCPCRWPTGCSAGLDHSSQRWLLRSGLNGGLPSGVCVADEGC